MAGGGGGRAEGAHGCMNAFEKKSYADAMEIEYKNKPPGVTVAVARARYLCTASARVDSGG